MLANTAAYRVAMVCGPNVRDHIRFAVFALFERFTEKGVRVVMLAQEVVSSPIRKHTTTLMCGSCCNQRCFSPGSTPQWTQSRWHRANVAWHHRRRNRVGGQNVEILRNGSEDCSRRGMLPRWLVCSDTRAAFFAHLLNCLFIAWLRIHCVALVRHFVVSHRQRSSQSGCASVRGLKNEYA